MLGSIIVARVLSGIGGILSIVTPLIICLTLSAARLIGAQPQLLNRLLFSLCIGLSVCGLSAFLRSTTLDVVDSRLCIFVKGTEVVAESFVHSMNSLFSLYFVSIIWHLRNALLSYGHQKNDLGDVAKVTDLATPSSLRKPCLAFECFAIACSISGAFAFGLFLVIGDSFTIQNQWCDISRGIQTPVWRLLTLIPNTLQVAFSLLLSIVGALRMLCISVMLRRATKRTESDETEGHSVEIEMFEKERIRRSVTLAFWSYFFFVILSTIMWTMTLASRYSSLNPDPTHNLSLRIVLESSFQPFVGITSLLAIPLSTKLRGRLTHYYHCLATTCRRCLLHSSNRRRNDVDVTIIPLEEEDVMQVISDEPYRKFYPSDERYVEMTRTRSEMEQHDTKEEEEEEEVPLLIPNPSDRLLLDMDMDMDDDDGWDEEIQMLMREAQSVPGYNIPKTQEGIRRGGGRKKKNEENGERNRNSIEGTIRVKQPKRDMRMKIERLEDDFSFRGQ